MIFSKFGSVSFALFTLKTRQICTKTMANIFDYGTSKKLKPKIRVPDPSLLSIMINYDYVRMQCTFRCEFFNSFRTRLDLEWSFWKITLNSCSLKSVSKMPSRITMPSLLFKTGCCNMSNSIIIPDRDVSEPITLRKLSGKLEKSAALATMRVLILVFSSRGCLGAAGYLKKNNLNLSYI